MERTKQAKQQKVWIVLFAAILVVAIVLGSASGIIATSSGTKVTSSKGLDVRGSGSNWYTYRTKDSKRVSYDGVASNKYGWWYCHSGKVNFSYDGLEQNDYGWWYCQDGEVKFNYTGLAKNDYGWWYCKDSKVDFSYQGLATNKWGTWYCKGGKVQFGYTGTYTTGGKTYNIKEGKVTGTASTTTTKKATTTTKKSTTTTTTKKATTTTKKSTTTTTKKATTTTTKSSVTNSTSIVPDISRWNGDVNFTTMHDSGVAGLMIRAAYGEYRDKYFNAYSAACDREDVPYGVYHFATWHYDTTKSEAMTKAQTEAYDLISYLDGKNVTGYVALDLELESGSEVDMTPAELTSVANYYFSIIRSAGYKPMLYCSISWLYDRMVPDDIDVPLWIAYYYDNGSSTFPNNKYGKLMKSLGSRIKLWQYSCEEDGSTYGASEEYIDLNYLYGSFAAS